jgi:predicted DNA-binding transcriptional regulator AlpA
MASRSTAAVKNVKGKAHTTIKEDQPARPSVAVEPEDTPRQMLNEDQILELVPISRVTLYRMEKLGRFPKSTYVSPNRRLWFASEVAARRIASLPAQFVEPRGAY